MSLLPSAVFPSVLSLNKLHKWMRYRHRIALEVSMPRGRPVAGVALTTEQREQLDSWSRRPNPAQALAHRCSGVRGADQHRHCATVGQYRYAWMKSRRSKHSITRRHHYLCAQARSNAAPTTTSAMALCRGPISLAKTWLITTALQNGIRGAYRLAKNDDSNRSQIRPAQNPRLRTATALRPGKCPK